MAMRMVRTSSRCYATAAASKINVMPEPLEYVRPIFEERQSMRLSRWWNVFAVVVALIAIAAVVVLFRLSHNALIRSTAALILVPAVLTFALPRFLGQLVSRVDGQGLHIRFAIFPWTHFAAADILTIEPWTYEAFKEFGGYGLRLRQGGGRGDCYTLAGDRAVRLTLRSGRKVTIGTEQPDALATAVRSLLPAEPVTPPA